MQEVIELSSQWGVGLGDVIHGCAARCDVWKGHQWETHKLF